MSERQERLIRWNAGFFDGEGHIGAEVGDRGKLEVSPRLTINHSYQGGLFDAEGSLSAKVRQNDDSTHGYSIAAEYGLKHTDYDAVLESLCGFAEHINADYSVRYRERDNEKHADQFCFRISNRDDIKRYLSELKPHLVLKKQQAEIMLDKIIPALDRGQHTNRRGFLRVMESVDRMNELKGGDRGKYNVEYFEDEWGMKLQR
jgi:hypothetical protein